MYSLQIHVATLSLLQRALPPSVRKFFYTLRFVCFLFFLFPPRHGARRLSFCGTRFWTMLQCKVVHVRYIFESSRKRSNKQCGVRYITTVKSKRVCEDVVENESRIDFGCSSRSRKKSVQVICLDVPLAWRSGRFYTIRGLGGVYVHAMTRRVKL